MRIGTWWPALALAVGSAASGQEFHAPVRLEAAGKPIDVDSGHAAPYLYDFDRDGVRDLLVGQFGDGKLLVHRNAGSEARPAYAAGVAFEAGGRTATVPAG
mgnify:CR=1 FL=1